MVSAAPLLYEFAVSKKFTPAAMHRSTALVAADSSMDEPKVRVPKQSLETVKSVVERVR
jgi:hypothetical protein